MSKARGSRLCRKVTILAAGVALVCLCSIGILSAGPEEHTVTAGNERLHFTARPDLGYVVKAHQDPAAIEAMGKALRENGAEDIRPVGGLGRKGVCVVHRQRADGENEKAIAELRTCKEIAYTAPLFSSNGETVAVIPEIVIRVHLGVDARQVHFLCQSMALGVIKPMEFTTQEYLIQVLGPDGEAVFTALENLNKVEWMEWAAPNTASQPKLLGKSVPGVGDSGEQLRIASTGQDANSPGVFPNDEYFPIQWHLQNTGQSGGMPGADIRAPEAWEITTGDPNIVVAVLDCGVDSNHPDLVNNLVPGYDFYDNDDEPDPALDYYGNAHGTACAGLIAAHGNNGIGMTGVTWNCKVMPIRVGRIGTGGTWVGITLADGATAIRWAGDQGADILSTSWYWGQTNVVWHSAVVDVTKTGGLGRQGKGCLFFTAAGNGPGALIPQAVYPEVIAVGATDHNNVRCSYSDYGPQLDVVAPSGWQWTDEDWISSKGRGSLWTTDISGPAGWNLDFDPNVLDYTGFNGTSGACPIAAGVTALILSVEPNLTGDEVRYFLERSAKDLGAPGRDDYYGWGRVDARAALERLLRTRADLDGDQRVNLKDFSKLAQDWSEYDSPADIVPGPYNERKVDYGDLAILAKYWLISPEIAWGPSPEDEATSVVADPDVTLSWNLGDLETEGYTVSYIVYFGVDEAAMAELDTVEQTSYDVSGRFMPLRTYYWRIDTKRRLNVPPFTVIVTPGNIWRFTMGP